MERAELRELVLATGCAVERGDLVFLGDPAWSPVECAQAAAVQAEADRRPPGATGGWLGVPTGGTSGRIRFARHDERTLTAAARGFCTHFGLARVNAVDVLPAFHVSGLMARVRCRETGGTHLAWSWKRLEAGEWPVLPATDDGWVLSLVPTQLQRLLANPSAKAWLRGLRVVFLGGAPAWPALLDAAAEAAVPLALSYGMTETAAMVTALRPAEFLAGERHAGRPLPHARVTLAAEDAAVEVAGESLFHGYYPEWREERALVTADACAFTREGGLRILRRRDAAIITGGEKVQPEEVEQALRATGAFADVVVLGRPHAEWGEEVVACYRADGPDVDLRAVMAALNERLAPYKRPKRFLAVQAWPRNAQGKINRVALRAAIERSAGVDPGGER